MTETPGTYNYPGKPEPKSKAELTTLAFVTAINSFHWNTDFVKFCDVLELTPDNYAEQKYSEFQELISDLNKFDPETLAKMITAGGGNR
jgi:hypothetical protein